MKIQIAILSFLVFLTQSNILRASLGGDAKTVEKDQQILKAKSLSKIETNVFSVHEINLVGSTVREYAGNDGKVFAVAWEGRVHPDLESLLGDYFLEFTKANRSTPKARGQRNLGIVESSNLHVSKFGTMGALSGKAILVDKLPAGITADDIH